MVWFCRDLGSLNRTRHHIHRPPYEENLSSRQKNRADKFCTDTDFVQRKDLSKISSILSRKAFRLGAEEYATIQVPKLLKIPTEMESFVDL